MAVEFFVRAYRSNKVGPPKGLFTMTMTHRFFLHAMLADNVTPLPGRQTLAFLEKA